MATSYDGSRRIGNSTKDNLMSIKDLEASQKPIEVQQLQARFKEIEHRLIDGSPGIVEAMVDIHRITHEHEELVLLFDDDDIAKLHSAHEKHKQFTLFNKELKAQAKNSKASLKNLKASDL